MECSGNNEQVEQAPQAPAMCANQCGFFASSAGLCSKCFRDAQLKQHQQQQATASLQTPTTVVVTSTPASAPTPVAVQEPQSAASASAAGAASPVAELAGPSTATAPAAKAPSRCAHPECKKKVGLTGFKCKCEQVFCGSHRLAEDHDCIYDHKGFQRQKLAAANPVVQASKVQKI